VYNAAVWLRMVQDQVGEPLDLQWRSFPLEQVNSEDDEWLVWNQSLEETKSLRAFLAAEVIRSQKGDALSDFVLALLKNVHEKKQKIDDPATIREAANEVGLDGNQILKDSDRPERRKRIAADYRAGVDEYGVFGTPTLLFDGGNAVFLNMTPPPAEEAGALFDSIKNVSKKMPYVREIKKPRKPE
jgi:protein-disulfide isomerase-like protein with CxxC motif